MRNQNYGSHCLANLGINLDEIQFVATTYWFVKAHSGFFWGDGGGGGGGGG